MLVLTRKAREKIMIGDDIEVTILSVQKGIVRVGIMAPRAVSVHRQEIYDEIRAKEVMSEKP